MLILAVLAILLFVVVYVLKGSVANYQTASSTTEEMMEEDTTDDGTMMEEDVNTQVDLAPGL